MSVPVFLLVLLSNFFFLIAMSEEHLYALFFLEQEGDCSVTIKEIPVGSLALFILFLVSTIVSFFTLSNTTVSGVT